MSCVERTITVRWRHRVFFTRGMFDPANPLLRDVLAEGTVSRPARALVVLDAALARARPALAGAVATYFAAFPDRLRLVAPPWPMEGGEPAKNSGRPLREVLARVNRGHIDRQSYVVAVGGGALLDVVGLAAAIAHRGVRLVRVPTTTLAQADAGVGVKNGINAFGKKNFIGAFAPPFAVINDFDLLASLSARDQRAGFVEAVKVAAIRDAAFFETLEREADALVALDPAAMQRLIRRCAELHVNHIADAGDPFEFGSARPLDFGHWAAHKLEALSQYRLRHGEAVAIGIALDTVYSRRAGYLDAASAERVLALLARLGFVLFADELEHRDTAGRLRVLEGLEEFREHLGGELTVTMLQSIGRGFEVHDVDAETMAAAVEELRQWRETGRMGGATA